MSLRPQDAFATVCSRIRQTYMYVSGAVCLAVMLMLQGVVPVCYVCKQKARTWRAAGRGTEKASGDEVILK